VKPNSSAEREIELKERAKACGRRTIGILTKTKDVSPVRKKRLGISCGKREKGGGGGYPQGKRFKPSLNPSKGGEGKNFNSSRGKGRGTLNFTSLGKEKRKKKRSGSRSRRHKLGMKSLKTGRRGDESSPATI